MNGVPAPSGFPPPGSGRVVVVGAGTAGCVAARRLVDAGHHVVVLESGPAAAAASVPALASTDHFRAHDVTDRWWPDVTASRTSAGAARPYLLGRGLGGSSAVNGLMAEVDPEDPAFHGFGGDVVTAIERVRLPVEPTRPDEIGPLSRGLLASGVGRPVALSRRDGRRVDVGGAYLDDVLHGEASVGSLELHGHTLVDCVEHDPAGRPVVVTAAGARWPAAAVVLGAGAIHTPAILLRSGLGSEVGTHVQDHLSVSLHVTFRHDVGPPAPDEPVTGAVAERDGVQLLPLDRLAPLRSTHGDGALLVALMEPSSAAGTIALASSDPHDPPRVDLRLDADRGDVDRVVDAVHWALDTLHGAHFRAVVDRVSIDERGTPATVLVDRVRAREWVRDAAGAYHHVAGGCGLGRTIGGDGEVLGAAGVFVVDAAAFGTIPRTGTHLPTVVVAEMLTRRWSA